MNKKKIKLDKEELELENSLLEWKSTKSFKKDASIAKNAAKNYLSKNRKINTRTSNED